MKVFGTIYKQINICISISSFVESNKISMFSLIYVLLVFSLLLSAVRSNILRNTENGKVKGKEDISSLGQKYYAFRSVPYALPPINGFDDDIGVINRRFKVLPHISPTKFNSVKSIHLFYLMLFKGAWTTSKKTTGWGSPCFGIQRFLSWVHRPYSDHSTNWWRLPLFEHLHSRFVISFDSYWKQNLNWDGKIVAIFYQLFILIYRRRRGKEARSCLDSWRWIYGRRPSRVFVRSWFSTLGGCCFGCNTVSTRYFWFFESRRRAIHR